jgi:sugar phosphate isomerase/epimerase
MIMRIAIREALLPGETSLQKLKAAQAAGIEGVAFEANGLAQRVPDIVAALTGVEGVQASAVVTGPTRLLAPEYKQRDDAIAAIRQAMADSLDLGASGVVFLPHYSASAVLPDLRPYKFAGELEAEMLVKQLKMTLCDLAYALGAHLFMHIGSRTEAHLPNRIEDGATVLRRCDDHGHLHLSVNLAAAADEEEDPAATLAAHARHTSYVHVSDSGRRIPGAGNIDFKTLFGALKGGGYDGWLSLAMKVPNINDPAYPAELAATVAMLRDTWEGADQ